MNRWSPKSLTIWLANDDDLSSNEAEVAVIRDVHEIAQRLARKLRGHEIENEEDHLDVYAARIGRCLEYHCSRMAEFESVQLRHAIKSIETGHLSYGQVQANILEEVVLAQALELGENRAAEVFEADYMPIARAIAGRVGGQRAVDAVENLMAELIMPREDRPPKLSTFLGKTPMAAWLRAVVANYWISQTRRKMPRTGTEIPEQTAETTLGSNIDRQHCEDLLQPVFAEAVGQLSVDDRVMLKTLILDGVPQNRMAASLGINPGTLTRRRQKAAAIVFDAIRRSADKETVHRGMHDCLDLILAGNSTELRQRLSLVLAAEIRGSNSERAS